jgi:anti-sigma factor RsiW
MTSPTDKDPGLLVHAYVDGELDPAHALEFEQQLAGDPALAAQRDRIDALRRVIGERLPPPALPLALARRVEASVLGSRAAPAAYSVSSRPSWRALAASVLLSLFVASGATWFVVRPSPADEVADMVLASHVRALMAPQPADVASSDQHTVKPWFNGKLPEAPQVVDLGSEGFPLIGGRIDVIGRTPVPTLVYRRRQHLISLLAIPDGKGAAEVRRAIAGYNLVSWSEKGVRYWAVSDVAAADLDAFAKAFRDASA